MPKSGGEPGLEQEVLALAQEPSGVGLDVPDWLVELNDEVERVQEELFESPALGEVESYMARVHLSYAEIQRQLIEGLDDVQEQG